jgi:nucleoside-diphosphate-sugar epimerase
MGLRVAVTGASGFVGSAIANQLTGAGHEVIALTRRPVEGREWRSFNLAEPHDRDLLAGVDSLVHCAYDLRLTSWEDIATINIGGTRRLLDVAKAAGVRCQLISSMSAYAGTRQYYGRAKLACEADTLNRGGNAVRLGLVYGGEAGGMISSLERLSQLPFIPIFGARSRQFMVHIEDAGSGLRRLVEAPHVSGQVAGLAWPEAVRFGDLIRALGARNGRRPRLIPVPWRPVYYSMRLAEAMGLSLPIRADSVLGLVRPAPALLNGDLWRELGVTIRIPDLLTAKAPPRKGERP